MIGPVQVLVLGFDDTTFSGEVLAELRELRSAGIVRLVDLLLVVRAEDGTLHAAELPEDAQAETSGVAAALLSQSEAAEAGGEGTAQHTTGSTWSLADALAVGQTAVVALIEHLWAAPLRAAVQQGGGTLLEEAWLAADDLRLLEDLIGRSAAQSR
jgi:hypothetical protein